MIELLALRQEALPAYLGGSNVITDSLTGWGAGGREERAVKDVMLRTALEMGKGPARPLGAPRGGKGRETGFS